MTPIFAHIQLYSSPLYPGSAWLLGDGVQEERYGLVYLIHAHTAQDFLQKA